MEISRRTLLLKNTNELISPLTFREIHSLRSTLLPSKEVRTRIAGVKFSTSSGLICVQNLLEFHPIGRFPISRWDW